MSEILNHLRTASAPSHVPQRKLLPLPQSAPQLADLSRHPIAYLTYALDCVSPLLRIRQLKGVAGGGASLQIPQPLTVRQRRRTAIVWILDAVEKRKGGTSDFPKRFAEELVSVIEGRSGVWGRRDQVHRAGIAGRSNLSVMQSRRK